MKKIIVSLLAVCILALPACGESTQSQFDIGEAALLDEDYESAIDAFTQAIENNPDLIEAYIERAKAYIGLGETEENLESAQKDYETALEMDEENVDAELGLADVYIREGEYDAALEILEEGEDQSDGDEAIEDKIAEFDSDELYDSSGNVRRRVGRDESGEIIWYHELTYDEMGREASVTSFDFDGNQTGHVDMTDNGFGATSITYGYMLGNGDYDIESIKANTDSDIIPGQVYKVEEEFDDSGYPTKRSTYNPDGTLRSVENDEYDEVGNCVREEYFDADGNLETRYENEYDDEGNVVSTSLYTEGGKVETHSDFEYDEDGNQIKNIGYDQDGLMSRYIIYEYDDEGNQIKESTYDRDDALISYTTYQYDKAGNCIEKKDYDASGNEIMSITEE